MLEVLVPFLRTTSRSGGSGVEGGGTASGSTLSQSKFLDRLDDALKAGEGIHPLERLPCANVEAATHNTCPNDGKLACGVCKLVSYCSKTCQQKHWPVHTRDCEDKIRSDDWKPAWVIECRSPSFVASGGLNPLSAFKRAKEVELAVGLHLWGGVPAVDVINLSRNENDINKNFSLAFVASGDIRNIVQTITALPSSYNGQIKILLNDREPHIAIRNIALLLLLGTVDRKNIAAELALHFWYSVFIPIEHHARLSTVMLAFLQRIGKEGDFSVPLGSRSTLSGKLPPDALDVAAGMLTAHHQLQEAVSEYERVRFVPSISRYLPSSEPILSRFAPSRQDRHHRHYCRLEPSHRLAYLEFRRFGLLLPFGALNSQFNTPNNSLFSPDGRWLQDDLADPLDSWDIEAVIKAGLAHGAQRADIYGCLYFFLSDMLLARVLGHISCSTAIYDNSQAFMEFLEKQGITQALQETKLKLKGKHTIAPHRLCAPLDGRPDALPRFPDRESWYLHAQLGRYLWSERYVEFSRA
ncbi:hypothetical protein JAAARDRAFT_211116 [Jaapia argillacea MUCL 33604]|uniref:MYND-type domain-containing protein n=1 Tax=Jaapia argillacea MUCL 33604 TaxID=933084 RepID=A0A067PLK1_9AGAM|nr:hypothetical protein JAAARDRAFT_211116 [Jaapia argillacea MUCL 33604]